MTRYPLLPAVLLALALAACSPGGASPSGPAAAPGGAQDSSAAPGAADQPALTDPPASPEAQTKKYSEGRLLFEKKKIDLGEITQHEEHPLEFPFEVEGKEAVIITEAAPSCGCTDIRIEVDGRPYILGDPIEPGLSGRIFGTFESGTFKELKKTDITLRGNGLDMPIRLESGRA